MSLLIPKFQAVHANRPISRRSVILVVIVFSNICAQGTQPENVVGRSFGFRDRSRVSKELPCSLPSEDDGDEDHGELGYGILPAGNQSGTIPEAESHDQKLQ